MTVSGQKTLSMLRGTLTQLGSWNTLLTQAGCRVYPYQLGAMVRSDAGSGVWNTYGLGDFAVNDYVVPCSIVNYGVVPMFIPDLTRITKITNVSVANDQITVSPSYAVTAKEYLLNLGAEASAVPTYQKSRLYLWDVNAPKNNAATALWDPSTFTGTPYVSTGSGGQYFCWVSSDAGTTYTAVSAVDLLITDSSGTPIVVIPFVDLGAKV